MAIPESAFNRAREHRFYILAAILFPLIIVVGFARSYYLGFLFSAPPLPSALVQVHGLVMTLWMALFITQVWFISSKRIRLHQKLGMAGVALAILVVVTGFFTAAASAKFDSASRPPDIPPMNFVVVPLFDIVVFSILFSAAVYFRKRAANHKRLILLTAICLLPPGLGRFPVASMQALGPLFFFGVPIVLTILAIAYDTWQTGKINKVFLAGGLLLIASYPLRMWIGFTEPWVAFATWLTTWAA